MKKILLFLLVICFAVLLCVPAAPRIRVSAEEAVLSPVTEYPCPAPDTVLKKGDRGQEVCWVQEALNRVCGSGLTVDGDFGRKTEDALRDFQTRQGLTVSGKADAETVQALQSMLSPPAGAQTGESDANQQDGDETEPLLVLEARPHSGVLLKSYWNAYFRCAGLCVTHLPAFGKMLFSGAKALVIGAAAVLVFILFFSIILGGWKNADAGGGYVYKYLYDYSISEAKGCFGLGIWLASVLLILGIAVSPVIADCHYLSTFYDRHGSVCVGLAVMFMLFRLLAAFIIFKLGRVILAPVLYILCKLLLYPFRLLRDKIKKQRTASLSGLIPKKEQLYTAQDASAVILGICLVYMFFVPVIMAFIAK